jgi:hypothetical protein
MPDGLNRRRLYVTRCLADIEKALKSEQVL